jgi:uncharacterized protein YbjQ (UPF0145 family)
MKKVSLKNLSITKIKSSIENNRWAIGAVLIGTIVGFTSVYLCTHLHLIIFGFNIAYIVSPLIAGFTETIIAKRKHGHSTGAISAILVFITINIWGYAFPQDPITLNFLTLAGIGLAIQAAFPILINYIIFVFFLGSLTYVLGYLGKVFADVLDKVGRKPKSEDSAHEDGPMPLKTTVTSTIEVDGNKVAEYLGLVNGAALVGFKEQNGSNLDKVSKKMDKDPEKDLEKAIYRAVQNMDSEAAAMGADAVLEVQIEYINVGGIAGSGLMVNTIGNAVKFE